MINRFLRNSRGTAINLVAAVAAGAVMSSAFAAAPWFGMSFDRYETGEALSDKGATGSSWGELPAGLRTKHQAPSTRH